MTTKTITNERRNLADSQILKCKPNHVRIQTDTKYLDHSFFLAKNLWFPESRIGIKNRVQKERYYRFTEENLQICPELYETYKIGPFRDKSIESK